MDINEMHIAVDLELNKINSNLYDIFQAPEKDYFLNRAQERFVKGRYGYKSNPKKEGFEMSEKRIDDLRMLLVPNYYDTAYLVPTTDFDYTTKQRFYLPNDYLFLASNRSKVYFNECSQIGTTVASTLVNYCIITLDPTVASFNQFAINFYDSGAIIVSGFDYAQEDKNLFIDALLTAWSSLHDYPGWKLYYEQYKSISSPGNIIAVKEGTPFRGYLGYKMTGDSFTALNPLGETFHYYIGTNGTEQIQTNKYAQQDDIYTMQQDPFNKTNAFNPLIMMHTNCIDILHDKTFFVKEFTISYLRKPKLLSLSLNQSCELAEHTHAEIVRDAVNLMLEDIEVTNRLQSSLGVEATNE